ncbi:hypothetical protein COE07_11210 [Bacillus sp. AFS033286]|nr:hypothetical protein COE07_11210 [Bacillus sp. AFS033286]
MSFILILYIMSLNNTILTLIMFYKIILLYFYTFILLYFYTFPLLYFYNFIFPFHVVANRLFFLVLAV